MNWIFTMVFSGLLFSSNNGINIGTANTPTPVGPQIVSVKSDETDRFEQTYPLSPNGRVSVSNENGSITAEAWDRSEIKLIAIKTADSKERLNEIEVRIDAKADSFSVETRYGNLRKDTGWRNNGKLQVDYQLMIPRGAVLREITTVNGSVTISDFTNSVKVSAVNGTVKASNLRGNADLSTVNGEVAADFANLDAGSKLSLSTVNGKVNLTIPSDSNTTIKVDSLNGDITNDFGLPVRKGKYVGRDLYGRLGNGDARIKIDSVNGELKIMRQNDGKTPAPATDLLPQKEKDEQDWESVGNAAAAKAGLDIARADRMKARAEAAKALKDAEKELAKIRPDIERATAESIKIAGEMVNSEQMRNAINDGLKQQAAALARVADAAFFPSMPRVERRSNSFTVKGVPKIKVQAHGCAIRVTGWDRPEVKYSVTQFSSTRDKAPLDVKESSDDSGVTLILNADGDAEQTRIEIFVPKRSNLVIKTDGEIRLDGVSGEVDLTGQDGAINVRDVEGKLTVASTDGRIRVIGFRGEIATRTRDGLTSLEGDFSRVTANASTGEIVITVAEDAAATVTSRSPTTKVEGLRAVLVKEGNRNFEYRIGNGGAAIDIISDGQVLLRGVNALKDKH